MSSIGIAGSAVVTGGAGFIGSSLALKLVESGLSVTVLDNLSTGSIANLAPVMGKIRFIEGDISDPAACNAAMQGADYAWHLAALGSVPRSVADPVASNRTNVSGTLNVLWAAQQAGLKRIVFSSSSSIYGRDAALPQRSAATPRPSSPYAVTKLTGEHYMRVFWECYGLEAVSLRFFNVFGPKQDPNSAYAAVIPSFVSSLLSGQPGTIQGDGEQSRDFTYIEDCLQATIKAMSAEKAPGNSYNVACGRQTTVNELYGMIGEMLGIELPAEYVPARAGDVRHSLADISNTCADLGYHPEFTLREGLERSLEWYKADAAKG